MAIMPIDLVPIFPGDCSLLSGDRENFQLSRTSPGKSGELTALYSTGMLRQQYDTSVHVHMVCCSVPYPYEFFRQIDVLRTVSTRENKERLTEQIDYDTLRCSVHMPPMLMLFWRLYSNMQFFLQADRLQTFLRIRTGNPWQNQMSATPIYYR